MCPTSYKVGRLIGYGKHLVIACRSETMPQRVSDSGQEEKQKVLVRFSLSRRCLLLQETAGSTCRHLQCCIH